MFFILSLRSRFLDIADGSNELIHLSERRNWPASAIPSNEDVSSGIRNGSNPESNNLVCSPSRPKSSASHQICTTNRRKRVVIPLISPSLSRGRIKHRSRHVCRSSRLPLVMFAARHVCRSSCLPQSRGFIPHALGLWLNRKELDNSANPSTNRKIKIGM